MCDVCCQEMDRCDDEICCDAEQETPEPVGPGTYLYTREGDRISQDFPKTYSSAAEDFAGRIDHTSGQVSS